LYLSDKALGLIFRVELPTEDAVVITNWKVKGRPDGLSITRSKNLLVTVPKARAIKEFTTHGILIKHIQLDASMENPKQAVQLFSGDYVIGHAGGQQHRVCIVDADGNVKLSYGGPRGIGPEELNFPIRLTIDSHEHVYVADEENHRMQVLSPTLKHIGEMSFHGHQLGRPGSMHLDEFNRRFYLGNTNGRLIVASLVLTSSVDVWSKRRKT
jgi:sugar lactone lactonase YvrE